MFTPVPADFANIATFALHDDNKVRKMICITITRR